MILINRTFFVLEILKQRQQANTEVLQFFTDIQRYSMSSLLPRFRTLHYNYSAQKIVEMQKTDKENGSSVALWV